MTKLSVVGTYSGVVKFTSPTQNAFQMSSLGGWDGDCFTEWRLRWYGGLT